MHIAQIVLLIARFILIVALLSVNWSCIKTGTVKIFFYEFDYCINKQ